MMKICCLLLVGTLLAAQNLKPVLAESRPAARLSPEVQEFVSVHVPVVALRHVRMVDGTGAPAREDQTVIISGDKIQFVGDSAKIVVPAAAKTLELRGYTVIPGLIDVHGHMFYTAGNVYTAAGQLASTGITLNEMSFTYPRLYLGCGVTSIRTAGTIEPYTDLNLKRMIDQGMMPGPKMDVTSPYLEGKGTMFPQMHELTGAEDSRKTVAFWAEQGITSFKAYMHITRAELGAAIAEAHRHGHKVTGHLCSVTYREAVGLGIDNLEHGPLFTDTELVAGKAPDVCPSAPDQLHSQAKADINGPTVQAIMHDLLQHRVAVTSTLPVYELDLPGSPPLRREVLESMLPESRISYLTQRANASTDPDLVLRFKKEMQFEREFVKAGGMLLSDSDPTGVGQVIGGDLAGFGDQRQVELLVEAGFTPVEAIHIATANGAEFLGVSNQVGTIASGKQADLIVIRGDPSTHIEDIERVDTVFKDGVGYDSSKLINSVRGMVGLR
jgi:imidazolonepropionase-like amidohydrolase